MEGTPSKLPVSVREQVEIELKYDGYLKRQDAEIAKFKRMEGMTIPS